MKKKKIFFIIPFLFLPFLCIGFFHLIIPFIWIKVDEAFHCGKYDKSIEYLSFISYIQPKNSESYILKAWLLWSEAKFLSDRGLPYKEKLDMAVKTYKEGERKNPENWRIYYEEGIMWEAFGEKEKAIKAYYTSSKYSLPPYNRIYELKSKKFKIKADE